MARLEFSDRRSFHIPNFTIARPGLAPERMVLRRNYARMTRPKSLVVFCGSRAGFNPAWQEAGIALGRGLAERGIRLVYGGGGTGLMRAVADGALSAGGDVVGIIPDFLIRREVAHTGVKHMEILDSMHARKLRMCDLAEGFVSFAGGLGTFDETFEILTWKQLGLHAKPIWVCDVAGSAGPMLATIEQAIATGFAEPSVRDLYEVCDSVPALLARLD